MLALVEKCVDQQKMFLREHGDLEGQDKIKLALESMERALVLIQDDLDLFQQKMRSKVPVPIPSVKVRKATKSKG